MDRRERFADLEESLRLAMRGDRAGLWTALPGIVQSYDPVAKTVVVQPALQGVVQKQDGSAGAVNLPLLPDVPVCFPSGGGCSLTFPLAQGDEVLVIFSSRCIDGWWQSGGIQLPMEPRMHDLSDGFAIPGPRSQARKGSPASTAQVQLRTDDGAAAISLDPATHNVTVTTSGSVSLNADKTAALKGTLAASLTATGPASVSSTTIASMSAPIVTTSAASVNTVAGPFVMLGMGTAGNLAQLPAAAATLFQRVMTSGATSLFTNPIASNLTSLTSAITDPNLTSGLQNLVSTSVISQIDMNSIVSKLTGTGGLKAAADALGAHSDLLAGVTAVTDATLPHLNGILGFAGGLENVVGGAFGDATTALSNMTTSLTSIPQLQTAQSYVSGIVGSLQTGVATAGGVISTLTGHAATLNNFISSDKSAFDAVKSQMSKATGFLDAVAKVKSPSAAVQSVMTKVLPAATINTLKTVGG